MIDKYLKLFDDKKNISVVHPISYNSVKWHAINTAELMMSNTDNGTNMIIPLIASHFTEKGMNEAEGMLKKDVNETSINNLFRYRGLIEGELHEVFHKCDTWYTQMFFVFDIISLINMKVNDGKSVSYTYGYLRDIVKKVLEERHYLDSHVEFLLRSYIPLVEE